MKEINRLSFTIKIVKLRNIKSDYHFLFLCFLFKNEFDSKSSTTVRSVKQKSLSNLQKIHN